MSAVQPLARTILSAPGTMPVAAPTRNYRTLDTVERVKTPSVASSLSDYSEKHQPSSSREGVEHGIARVSGWVGGFVYFVSCLWIPLAIVGGLVYAAMGLFTPDDKENLDYKRGAVFGGIILGVGAFLGGVTATATWLAFSPVLLGLHGIDAMRNTPHKRPDVLSSFVHAVEQGGYDGGLFLLRMGDRPGEELNMPGDVSDLENKTRC